MAHAVKILMTEFVTHDVKRFIVEKPEGYAFEAGQATTVAIRKPDWEEKKRPFTFTSRAEDLVLEFTIKGYPEHEGVTQRLHSLVPGDELLIGDAWGAITYKGRGVFIAGGAGLTPFIAIFRRLRTDGEIEGNRLFFSNKTARDIILRPELEETFGDDLVLTVTREERRGLQHGRFDETALRELIDDVEQRFYVCGPPSFVEDVQAALRSLGASSDGIVVDE